MTAITSREAKRKAAQRTRIERNVRAEFPDSNESEILELVEQFIIDENEEQAQELAEYREIYGEPEDTPTIANCDDGGTGEGRYHGRM